MPVRRFQAIIFDKDGTLLDIDKTWCPAIAAAMTEASTDRQTRRQLATAMGFDLDQQVLRVEAPIMTLTNAQIAALADPLVDGWAFINNVATHAVDSVTPMPEAERTLDALRALRIPLAVVTNDDETSAVEQLTTLGWQDRFDPIYGYDSGHGCKPDPDVLLAATHVLGTHPSVTMMVGDSAVDLQAARAAGMTAVLIGGHSHNAHLADACISNLSEVLTLVQ